MERKDVTVQLGTARAVAAAGMGETPPPEDPEAGEGRVEGSTGDKESANEPTKEPRVMPALSPDEIARVEKNLRDEVHRRLSGGDDA